ncbi:ankyrin repeat-containing protein [Anaeramoeba ignava]|uniref:Ankyrin repeat-containing protein n=1 Tax=Anaeramoeba ignava TaxID=1746090 RepID=A0A9Q0R7U6_ANAIG|nr:ankyrin repeat-containing protein [Anaeramoeba ignava]
MSIFQAIRSKYIQGIKEFLKEPKVFEETYNWTPLHYACLFRPPIEVIEILLDAGADPNAKNSRTPLHNAIELKSGFPIIKLLIERGAKITIPTGYYPLHFAAENGSSLEIISLLTTDEIINQSSGSTPFSLAIFGNSSLEVINFLIEKGAKPSKKCDELFEVCKKKFGVEFLKKLKEIGYDFKSVDNKNVLFYSVKNGINEEEFLYLEEQGVSPKSLSDNQDSLLHELLKNPSVKLKEVEFLIKKGVDINSKNEEFPLGLVMKRNQSNSHFLVNSLIRAGIDINDPKYESLITSAFNSQKLDICKELSRIGIKYDKIDQHNWFQKTLSTYNTICDDFRSLLNLSEISDYKLQTIEGEIPAHKFMINWRLSSDPKIQEKFCEICEKKTKNEVFMFLEFLYSGIPTKKEEKFEENFANEIGLPSDWFLNKKNRFGILNDLRSLFADEETKDFTLVCDNEEIKVHRLVLMARSELFRGMFLSVNDSSNKVSDYSGKTISSLQVLVKFFYLDQIDEQMVDSDILSQLEDASDYYQLNQNSSFSFEFERAQAYLKLN